MVVGYGLGFGIPIISFFTLVTHGELTGKRQLITVSIIIVLLFSRFIT